MSKQLREVIAIFVAAMMLAVCSVFLLTAAETEKPSPPACGPEEKVEWLTYSQAISRAQKKQLPLLLFFYKDHCRQCEVLKEKSFNQPEIACYVNRHLAPAAVNSEREPTLAQQFNVTSAPTVWFLTPEMKSIDFFLGYVKPARLSLILRYIGERAYEKQSFAEYEKEQRAGKDAGP